MREQVSAEEWAARVDLAAAHRLLSHYGVDDLTYNHLSVRVPGEPDHLLIKAADMMFGEITASSLQKYDLDGKPLTPGVTKTLYGGGLVIHAGLFPARPDWHRFMVVIAAAEGFRLAERPVKLYPRRAGKSKFGIGRIPVGVFDLVSVWFQLRFGRKPMLFFGLWGALLVAAGDGPVLPGVLALAARLRAAGAPVYGLGGGAAAVINVFLRRKRAFSNKRSTHDC